MTNIVYVDMDGVIADFKGWISQYGTFTEDDWYYPENAVLSPWKVMEDNINTCYIDFQPLDLLQQFSKMYNENTNLKFLSALPAQWFGTNKWNIAKHNKLAWLLKNIDNFCKDDLIVTKGAKSKVLHCNIGDTLYDDRQDTIDKWNTAGGHGIYIVGKSCK